MAKKYIVGVDFGHGETAAWVVPMIVTAGIKPEGESVRLKATNKVDDQVLHSVVYKTQNGVYTLKKTIGSSIMGKMKSRVSDLRERPDVMAAYQAYIKLVIEAIIKHNDFLELQDVDGEPNFYLCMASPTQWNDEDKNEYLQFFNEAIVDLGVSFEWIINESDAAFFSHKEVVNHEEVTLLIDYGSSTIDYTVMYKGKKISKDEWSNAQLGAGNIEGAILDSYRSKDYDGYQHSYSGTEELLRITGNPHIDIDNVLDYECRLVKEAAYTHVQDRTTLDYHLGEYTGLLTQFRNFRFEYDFSMSEITEKYRKAVELDLQNLKAKIEGGTGKKINKVILSGGACIMNWVGILVASIFTDAKLKDDRHPSYVVARGIALYALAQKKALTDLLSALNKVDYAVIYKNADVKATKDAICELSGPAIEQVRKQPNCHKMVDCFGNFIQSLDKNNVAYVSKMEAKVCDAVTQKVRSELKSAIKHYFNLEIDTSAININVAVDCIRWDPKLFTVNWQSLDVEKTGMWSLTIMVAIHKILERHKTFFMRTNWMKERDQSERNRIANELVNEVLNWTDWLDDEVSYGEGNEFLKEQADSIKKQVLVCAEMLFYEHQLFRTTFTEVGTVGKCPKSF